MSKFLKHWLLEELCEKRVLGYIRLQEKQLLEISILKTEVPVVKNKEKKKKNH